VVSVSKVNTPTSPATKTSSARMLNFFMLILSSRPSHALP
jgi:hypothetical protein